MKKNYILIDYENIQPKEMPALEQEHFNIIVFVGANQAKVSFEVASALQRMGDKATYVKVSGNGSNALDFHIAYYMGQLAAKEPDAYFHIISKDTGYDPLIQHLKSKKILAGRCKSVSHIPIIKIESAQTPSERIAAVIEDLKHRGASRPRTVKTLSSTINALFSKTLTEAEISHIISELGTQGVIQVNEKKIAYVLPDEL